MANGSVANLVESVRRSGMGANKAHGAIASKSYSALDMDAKRQYAKYNGAVNLLKAITTIACADEDMLHDVLSILPKEVYAYLTHGQAIGARYLDSITMTPKDRIDAAMESIAHIDSDVKAVMPKDITDDLTETQKTALQMSKVWQDLLMPIRKFNQWAATDATMTRRFKEFIDRF